MNILHVYHSSKKTKREMRSFIAGPGAYRNITRMLIKELNDTHFFATIRELHEAQKYSGMRFDDVKIDDRNSLSTHAREFLIALIRTQNA